MMNCKENDIARVIFSEWPDNVNKLVRVVEEDKFPGIVGALHGHVWWIETLQPMMSSAGPIGAGAKGTCPDKWLRTLHDGDGVDEMLQHVGKPQPIETQQPKERTYG